MKKTLSVFSLILILSLCFSSLSACSNKDEKEDDTTKVNTTLNYEIILDAITSSVDNYEAFVPQEESYVRNFIKADPASFQAFSAMVQSEGTKIDEFGIFEVKDPSDLSKTADMAAAYLDFYRDTLWDTRYHEEEYPKLRDAESFTVGDKYVVYLIMDDNARTAVKNAINRLSD